MKVHLNEADIKRALTSVYVEPLLDYSQTDIGEEIPVSIELKATRGVEGMTCDIVIGEDHSAKPLGIEKAVTAARDTQSKDDEAAPAETAQAAPQQPAQSETKTEATEQPVEAPKRRGRPPGSKNKATIEAEQEAAAQSEAQTAAAEEEDVRPEPTEYVKSGGLFANRTKPSAEPEETPQEPEAAPTPEPEPEAPFNNNSGDDDISETHEPSEPSEEETLAAEAQRTEPQEEPVEETPKPTRSLFGNLTRPKND